MNDTNTWVIIIIVVVVVLLISSALARPAVPAETFNSLGPQIGCPPVYPYQPPQQYYY